MARLAEASLCADNGALGSGDVSLSLCDRAGPRRSRRESRAAEKQAKDPDKKQSDESTQTLPFVAIRTGPA